VEGAVWLAGKVWPIVRRQVPTARLAIVGSSPTRAVMDLDNAASGVVVKGSVPDVRPELWSAAVAAAPLRTARGIQNKVLEAAAAGLPVVVTPAVMEGLPAEVHPACAVADTEEAFALCLVRWLQLSGEERRAIAARAALTSISWQQRLAPLQSIFAAATPR